MASIAADETSLLPPDGNPPEYVAAFEAVCPQPRYRRQYIDDAISKGKPSFGPRVLVGLIADRKVDCVFTTKFDPLVGESAVSANALLLIADQAQPTVAAIGSGERAMRCRKESDCPLWPSCMEFAKPSSSRTRGPNRNIRMSA